MSDMGGLGGPGEPPRRPPAPKPGQAPIRGGARRSSPTRGQAPVTRRRRGPRSFDFSAGAALSRGFTCFGRHFPVLMIFGFVVFIPVALYSLSAGREVWDRFSPYMESGMFRYGAPDFWGHHAEKEGWVGRILEMAFPLIVYSVVTMGVFQFLSGGRVSYGRSFGQGMARLLPVIGVTIFTVLLIWGSLLVCIFVLGMFLAIGTQSMAGIVIAVVIAAAVAAMIHCVFFVAVQACVVERIGPSAAMSRSSWLTRGARWKVFGINLMIWGAALVSQLVIQGVFDDFPSTWGQAQTGILISVALLAFFAVIQAVVSAVVYHDLRNAKEGTTVDELLRVFD